MKTLRATLTVLAGATLCLLLGAGSVLAQSSVHPTATPEVNNGGWVWDFLFRPIFLIGVLTVVVIVIFYLRYAPRFAKDEESARVVHADRVLPGQEPPRRAVDLSQAVPVVVQPPAVPSAIAAAAAPAAAATPPAAAPAPAAAAPPAAEAAPAPAAAAPPAAEAAPAPAPAPAAPAPAAEERQEVSMDQETFDKTLEELLAAGTDRRIAEGKARRAAMIAAKKKAAGGA